ncbi:MAG: hypothetical protein K0R10_668 [Alphaproteobacteria bacterium]|jgi:hypothetical protein|nr:hypothetical protein [Alphaproteobacteria bacterium]
MGTTIYHGSRTVEGIETIDLTKAKSGGSSSEYGIGFYTSLNRADGETNAFSRGSTAGWVYEFEVKGNFDSYTTGHRDRWISGFEDVTRELVQDFAKGMAKLGGDFEAAGAALLEKFDAGKFAGHTGRNFIMNLQSEYGVPRADNAGKITSADILDAAGYDGLRGNGGQYFVFMNPKTMPVPVPHAFAHPGHPQADAVGRVLAEISALKMIDEYGRGDDAPKIQPHLMRDLRFAVAEIVTDVMKGNIEAYPKMLGVRNMLEETGVPLSDHMKRTLDAAEQATGAIAKLPPEQISARREAEALVKDKPERIKGEGFNDYKDRVFAWYDANNPNATEAQQRGFSHALFDTLYRDAQQAYAVRTLDALAINHDPAKLERMLAQDTSWGLSRSMGAIQHIEYDLDTMHSKPGFKLPEPKSAPVIEHKFTVSPSKPAA